MFTRVAAAEHLLARALAPPPTRRIVCFISLTVNTEIRPKNAENRIFMRNNDFIIYTHIYIQMCTRIRTRELFNWNSTGEKERLSRNPLGVPRPRTDADTQRIAVAKVAGRVYDDDDDVVICI